MKSEKLDEQACREKVAAAFAEVEWTNTADQVRCGLFRLARAQFAKHLHPLLRPVVSTQPDKLDRLLAARDAWREATGSENVHVVLWSNGRASLSSSDITISPVCGCGCDNTPDTLASAIEAATPKNPTLESILEASKSRTLTDAERAAIEEMTRADGKDGE